MSADPVPTRPRFRSLLPGAGIGCVFLGIYFFLFPLPVLAADAAGFSLRDRTKIGEKVTDPIVFLARRIPPYEAYLKGSRQFMEFLYLGA